jgi:MFS family permease
VRERIIKAGSQPGQSPPDERARAVRYASYVFWLLFVINFLNYLDRSIFAGLGPVIQSDLKLNDLQVGILGSAFSVVYTLVALPLGFLADRIARKTILALGVGVWSLATMFTGLAASFAALLGIRALLGIGEGSYFPSGTPLLAAYFPPLGRARVLARWGVGALIGAAAGFLVAAPFSRHPGEWRLAFFFTGAPGLVCAALVWRLREKTRHEEDPPIERLAHEGHAWWERVRAYLHIPTVRVIIALHALGFFAITSVTGWMTFYLRSAYGRTVLHRDQFGRVIGVTHGVFAHAGLSPAAIPILVGAVILLGGTGGYLYGGALADRLVQRYPGARVLTGGVGFLLAAPCLALAIGAPYVLRHIHLYRHAGEHIQVLVGVSIFVIFGLLGSFFVNLYNGPVTAALLDVVPANERSAADGTELTLSHLLGDVYAPAAVGGLAELLSHQLGGEQIGLALLLTAPAVLTAAGLVGIWGSRFYPRDVAALGTT